MEIVTQTIINETPNTADFVDKCKSDYHLYLTVKQAKKVYLRTRLAEAQNWKCCFCGVECIETPLKSNSATVEHVIPRSNGGTDDFENLVMSCYACNTNRGNLDADVFYQRKDEIAQNRKNSVRNKLKKRFARYAKRAEMFASNGWNVSENVTSFDEWKNTLRLEGKDDMFLEMVSHLTELE